VTGEDLRVYESFEGVPPPAEQVTVDGTGEATASFSRLRPRQGYGLQWLFPEGSDSTASGGSGLTGGVLGLLLGKPCPQDASVAPSQLAGQGMRAVVILESGRRRRPGGGFR
jgi:hypothetical protein